MPTDLPAGVFQRSTADRNANTLTEPAELIELDVTERAASAAAEEAPSGYGGPMIELVQRVRHAEQLERDREGLGTYQLPADVQNRFDELVSRHLATLS